MRTDTVSRRTLLAGIAGLAALPLAACASGPSTAATLPDDLVRAAGVSRQRPDLSAPVTTVTAGMIALGHELCRAGATSTGNWVSSPLSIACAFAMARAGALGATAASMDRFFGFPATGRDEAFNAITQAVVTTDGPPRPAPSASPSGLPAKPVVSLGNALFAQHGFALQPAFLRILAAQYGSGVRTVDFTGSAAVGRINDWVSAETAGRIRELFNSLDPSTKLVIANTVYLRASWQDPFGEYPSTAAPFHRADGTVASVPTMRAVGVRSYATGASGWQALSLPYADGRTDDQPSDVAMWLILPPPGGSPVDMLSASTLSAVAGRFTSTPVDVTVPKWNFTTSIDLTTVLPDLGLHDVIGTGDFTGIASGLDGISGAVHRATITVDETGTEAAAATGLAYATSAMAPPNTTFHADRPFAFTIVGGPAHTPLFSGVVGDPATR
jgi:serpin B